MTDETTQPKYEFQTNGIRLSNSYYEEDVNKLSNILAIKQEIEDKLAKGEPVYVQIRDDRRKGSIGRIKSIDFRYDKPSPGYSYYSRYHRVFISNVEVVWDGRKNSCSPYISEIEYLPDWQGGCVWAWHKSEPKEKPPKVIPYDSLGQEIEPGLFVCFVHRLYGAISMKFGTVTRITDRGGVFVRPLKLRDNEKPMDELKAYDPAHLVIVNDKLMSRLTMARLRAD